MIGVRWFPWVAIAALTARYVILSGGAYEWFWNRGRERFAHLRIQRAFPSSRQLRDEVKWSLISFVVIASVAGLVYPAIAAGKSRLYFDVAERGWPYFLASIALLAVGHDTYFYFAHRFMHLKPVFRHVHRIHHLSTNPSPFAAFSFHPLETLIEIAFAGVMIFLVPLHFGALASFFFLSHVFNAMGHLGYEIFPRGWDRRFPMCLVNSATHHNLHHHYFNGNYGLYFNFWDRVFGTNQARYPEVFDEVTSRQPAQVPPEAEWPAHARSRETAAR